MLLLAAIAGDVNATGFFAVGLHTSHMSGNVAAVGEMLASGQWELARSALRLVLAFLLGAISAAVMLDMARHRQRGRHALALLVEALMLAVIGLWLALSGNPRKSLAMWGLAYAMGMQNALVTRVSGAVVRTTHITGIVTDIGLELVRMVTWVRDGARGQGARGWLRRLRELPSAVQFERVRLHLGLLLAFLFGCTLGPTLYLAHGSMALVVPGAALLLLAALDLSPAGALLTSQLAPAAARRP
ncbi:YoaK family protein [Myxococcaceae bacterium GXIMD 01537]